MIIEFSVSNFRSIGEKQTISFVAAKDDSLPENVISDNDPKLLKSMGIYGPNASGKSNIIRALGVMKDIVINSATVKPETEKPIQPFKLSQSLLLLPTEFEITFIHNEVRYQYGFVTTKTTVLEEWLIAYPKERAQTWFHRINDTNKDKSSIKFGPFLKGEKQRLKEMTRNDTLFLSVAAQFDHKQLKDIYNWFGKRLTIIAPYSMDSFPRTSQMLLLANKEKEIAPTFNEILVEYMRSADLGIFGLRVRPKKVDDAIFKFPANMSDELKSRIMKDFESNPPLDIETIHKLPTTEEEVVFNMEDEESDGTNRFFELLGPWLNTMSHNGVVVVDEIESSLHPLLTRELIKLIHNASEKGSSPQLLFTTHDVTLLSNDLLRRDQIWFIEKNERQESVLTPLTDYSPRKGEAILKGYMSGRYRGVPYLDDFAKNES